MPKLKVDGVEVEVPAGATVLQACETAGKEIPRFCYHERLSIAGNCRMCLVEVKPGPPKPQASCALPAMDDQEISTNSEMVKNARRGVMEFLLINHPLDCPICDQGGECDLQDQAMGYGHDSSRFGEHKRAVDDKNMGPLIKTIMTRCIHCTRCVRFSTEVAGVTDLGALGRGEDLEISTYLDKALTSELSGNVIDLCPVGALTSKPYAFVSRPWELKKTETIDVMDAVGSNIRVDSRGDEILRVLPRLHEDVNEEWISDKTRFACDGLKRQRLDRPFIRVNGNLVATSWKQALTMVANKMKELRGDEMSAIAGDLCDVESMYALKSLMHSLKCDNIDCRQDGAKLDASVRASYLFNATIGGIEKADAILLLGTNPRWEAPVLNARIRKRSLEGGMRIGLLGAPCELNYECDYLGDDPRILKEISDGTHPFYEILKNAERPMVIVGNGAATRDDGAVILSLARSLAEATQMIKDAKENEESWNGFCVLHTAASRVGGLDIGFVPSEKGLNVSQIVNSANSGDVKLVFLLGADEIDMSRLGKAMVIYQGHHGDAGAHRADVILPGAAYTEKEGLYVNTEGRVQAAVKASFPPGDAREDWKIIRALSEELGKPLSFDTSTILRGVLVSQHGNFGMIDNIVSAKWEPFGECGEISNAPFQQTISNFYMTDPISRCSIVMAECTEQFVHSDKEQSGTER